MRCLVVQAEQKQVNTMKFIRNKEGIALVTSLMLTMISLVIAMALMSMVISNIQVSAANKRYRTVLQSAYGATELVTKDILANVFNGYSTATSLQGVYTGKLDSFAANSCINQKFTVDASNWTADCKPTTFSPKDNPDISFKLQATTSTPFQVYAKVVDTFKGNTDSNYNPNLREALNVTESVQESGKTIPSSFRVEIQTERASNPDEKASLSVLYAY